MKLADYILISIVLLMMLILMWMTHISISQESIELNQLKIEDWLTRIADQLEIDLAD